LSSLDIVGLCGSLRRGSLNRMAMRLASECMPASMRLEVLEWREVPIYDGDVEAQGLPAPVSALRERIRRADGVLIGKARTAAEPLQGARP
jgi:chromate reductase